jgi:hypothetical protein
MVKYIDLTLPVYVVAVFALDIQKFGLIGFYARNQTHNTTLLLGYKQV